MTIRRIMALSLFTTAALILFLIELRLPPLLPIPGAKLGLANIVTVWAVYRFRAGEVLLMLLARILLSAFFAGQLTVLFYSLSGGLFSLAVSLLLARRIPENFLPLTSVFAAAAHNMGQLAAAACVMGTAAVLLWWPYLILAGAATGLFTGLAAKYILARRRTPFLHS